MRAARDGAEHVEIGEQCLGCRDFRAQTRRRGIIGESQDEQRIAHDQVARGRGSAGIVLIEATNLAGRESMRRDGLGETHAVIAVGARQRHQVLHRRMRDDVPVADVLLNRHRERAHQTEAARHPAHAPIEAPRDHVERQSVLLVQGAQQPGLLKHVLARVGLQQLAKHERFCGRHRPDDRGDRVAMEPVQTADALMAIDDEILRRAGHDHDRHLLPDLRERGQQPALAGRLPHTEPVVAPIQLVKFQVHGGRSVAPSLRNASTRHPQLRTRPPTDDAVLRRHSTAPDRRHNGESGESQGVSGTVIHHAATRAIRPLPVTMIETAFRTLLVTAPGRAHTGAPSVLATRR